MLIKSTYILILVVCFSCNQTTNKPSVSTQPKASAKPLVSIDSSLFDQSSYYPETNRINTGNTNPQELLAFARTLIGVPYKYGSVLPDSGFDCSGYITYVFNHFNIAVPRASVSFTNIEKEIPLAEAQPGDLILFTGTDTSIHTVGHMGIIERIEAGLFYFIQASSGKANGVTISPLDNYYKNRFVKVIRVFPKDNR